MQHRWHTARNEAIAIGGMGRLITSLYLQTIVFELLTKLYLYLRHGTGLSREPYQGLQLQSELSNFY